MQDLLFSEQQFDAFIDHVEDCEECRIKFMALMQFLIERSNQPHMAKAKTTVLTTEISVKLLEWKLEKERLDAIQETEFALRQWLVLNAGFDPEKLEGSQTLAIGNGWKLAADKTMNYNVTNEEGEALQVLNLLGSATGANRPDLAQSLVRWKPDLSVKTYKDVLPLIEALDDADLKARLKSSLAKAVTIKPGAPQLKLIAPDAEGAKA